MALAAPIVDGKLIQSTSQTASSSSTTSSSGSSTMDKDSFLQLLVAQMKYQDPLEPTSNTEYVSQYAQFSELEEMQNLGTNMDLQRATALVGKQVIMKTTNSSNEAEYVQGKVDYVISENNKVFLSINGKSYNLDDLDTVVDEEYLNAVNLASDWSASLNKLPNVANITLEYKSVIENLSNVYSDMSDYQKQYLSETDVNKLKEYVERIKTLTAQQEQNNN